MRCPYCRAGESRVLDSRDVESTVRRRRECLECGQRFTTFERVEVAPLVVVKKDGRREPFDREKLLKGIRKACEKRPLPTARVEEIVDDVEFELYQLRRSEVASRDIGERVMDRLRTLDDIAYIRFASVYRPFRDLQSLKEELQSLEPRRERDEAPGRARARLGRLRRKDRVSEAAAGDSGSGSLGRRSRAFSPALVHPEPKADNGLE